MGHGPTDSDLQRSVYFSGVLIGFALMAPILAVTLPHPDKVDFGNWFSRSGAVTTVFALLAEIIVIRANDSITPSGFGWTGLSEQIAKFYPRLKFLNRLGFTVTIIGTLIWAYGDIPFMYWTPPA